MVFFSDHVKSQKTHTCWIKFFAKKYMAENNEFTLLPSQIDHVTGGFEILLREAIYLELSEAGCGKTYMVMQICKLLGLRPFIISPKQVIKKWKKDVAIN